MEKTKSISLSLQSKLLLVIVSSLLSVSLFIPFSSVGAEGGIQIWWPTNGTHLNGTQPLKALVEGVDPSAYEMFWQVDGGTWNWMDVSLNGSPHRETSIDFSGWNWHGSGPYTITFIARQQGRVIAQQSVQIYVDSAHPEATSLPTTFEQTTSPVSTTVPAPVTTPEPTLASTPVTTPAPVATSVANVPVAAPSTVTSVPIAGNFYVAANSAAATQASAWAQNRPADSSAMQVLAAQPTAAWFGSWNSDVTRDVQRLVSAAAAQGTMPIMVAYNIPQRDCGGFSGGGSNNPAGYAAWIRSFAAGIGSSRAIVILEPDALAQMACLSQSDQMTRMQLMSDAVSTLKNNPNTQVYIDGGHSGWVDAGTMASRLTRSNVNHADGFALNVSNFMPNADEVVYGQKISSGVGGKHFVIDTSRNGAGSNGQWCNPSNAVIGVRPTTQTGNSLVDAFLWLKVPGESDGACNGGPNAGNWWPDYALQLTRNAR